MEIGISSYTYTWAVGFAGYTANNPLRPLDILQRAVDMGVKVVQFADNMPMHKQPDDVLDKIEKQAVKHGICIEIGTRGISSQNLEQYIHLAHRFKSPVLRTVVDTEDKKPSEDEIVSTIGNLTNELKRAGICLAIENHDRLTTGMLYRIIERINSDNVGICLDTTNSYGALEGVEVVVERLGPFVVNLHIKDFAIFRHSHKMGFIIEGRPAGQGMLDIPWLLERLHFYRRDPNAILELWTPPETNLEDTIRKEEEWARSSVAYLRTIVKECR